MLSGRVPRDLGPTAWARTLEERRARGAPLLDLTEANPTRVGLGGAGESELAALASAGAARYEPDPRGSESARAAVAACYGGRGLAVDPGDIVLTAGTSEAYAHLFRLLADPGGSFLVPAPSYPLFDPLAALESIALRRYRLAFHGRWSLDPGSLEHAFDAGARGVIVVQPNHPTGSCLAPSEIEEVEARCEAHAAAIVSDEVFGDFPWPPAEAPLPSLLGARRVPTFVLGGLSKLCGMPGMKLSWIVVAGPRAARAEALAGLEWIADLFLSVSTPVQTALPRLLGARRAFQVALRARLAANLATVRAFVARRPEFDLLPAEGGWVAVLRAPRVRSEEEWVLELMRRDVVVHPGHFYEFESEAHLVLSLIVEPKHLAEGLARLEALAADDRA
ncbi:MAG TPA: pyridoxal phosphate-dependent aminotransferase [Candidatus Eisenbacteria bacterium]|jgi:aspartate/methionine/tyrosine aminotransferase